ncbi:MAG: glycerophosphodiester phosphodiesterase [Gammaproteobacteria bacterium]|nr:glycerophosphodiester phosphodiesterase [Gammaproteobacteria bacterium]
MKTRSIWKLILAIPLFVLAMSPAQAQANEDDHDSALRWVIEDVLHSDHLPFAIGHRGYGNNMGENPDKPIENTVESVTRAYREGIQVVGLDVVITKDNIAVMMHDDYLGDKTCVNTLTYAELKQRFKEVSTLQQVLQTGRIFSVKNNADRPSGLLSIEIKAPAPMCDIDDVTIPALVAAVIADINHTKMEQQVLIESFSPEIIAAVKAAQPSIPRLLSLSMLQLLSPAQLQAITGMPVKLVSKQPVFGLQWVEIGPIYRLPIYESPYQYVNTLAALQSRAAVIDKTALMKMEQITAGNGALLIAQLHNIGISSIAYTVNSAQEWLFLSTLGIDGIYTDNIPMGLSLEGQ